MGHLESPSVGTALDVNYISQIVTAVNDLNDSLGNMERQSRIIDSGSQTSPKRKLPTSQLSVVTGRKLVSSDSNNKTNDVIKTTFFFNQNFKYRPVVTATPEINASGIKNNTLGVSVVVTEVSLNKVELAVIFNSDAKKTNIYINIIAVGTLSSSGA
jgi:hypothetical protein